MISFFPRVGGKRNSALKIIKHIPKHTTYIEPFIGAGSVFLRKNKVKYEIINDIDPDIYHIWIDMKLHGNTIKNMDFNIDKLQFYHYKSDEEDKFNESSPERLKRNLCLSFFSKNSDRDQFRYRRNNERSTLKKNCLKYKNRLKNVNILNKDFRDIINEYDRIDNDIFFYFDPPYHGADHGYKYGNELTPNDIYDSVKNMKNKFMISYWEWDGIRDIFNEYRIEEILVYYASRKYYKKEFLIMNYDESEI